MNKVYVVAYDRHTYEAYTLDRDYNLISNRVNLFDCLGHLDLTQAIDNWEGWACINTPEWAKNRSMMVCWMF